MNRKIFIILAVLIVHVPMAFGQELSGESKDSLANYVEVFSLPNFGYSSYRNHLDKIDYCTISDISKKNVLKVGKNKARLLSWYLKPIQDFIDFYGKPDKTSALSYVYDEYLYWCLPMAFSRLSDLEIPMKIYYWEKKQLTVFCIPDDRWFRYPESLSSLCIDDMSDEFERWLARDSGNEQWRIVLWKKGVFDLKQYKSFGILPYSKPFYEYSDIPDIRNVDESAIKMSEELPEIYDTFTRNNFFEFYSTLPIVWFEGNIKDSYCLNELYGMNYKNFISQFGMPAYNETYLYLPNDSRYSLPRITWPVDELLSNYNYTIIPLRIARYYKTDGYIDFWFIRNGKDFTYNAGFSDNIDIVNQIFTNRQNPHKRYLQWLAHNSDAEGWSLIYTDMYFYSNPLWSLSVEI